MQRPVSCRCPTKKGTKETCNSFCTSAHHQRNWLGDVLFNCLESVPLVPNTTPYYEKYSRNLRNTSRPVLPSWMVKPEQKNVKQMYKYVEAKFGLFGQTIPQTEYEKYMERKKEIQRIYRIVLPFSRQKKKEEKFVKLKKDYKSLECNELKIDPYCKLKLFSEDEPECNVYEGSAKEFRLSLKNSVVANSRTQEIKDDKLKHHQSDSSSLQIKQIIDTNIKQEEYKRYISQRKKLKYLQEQQLLRLFNSKNTKSSNKKFHGVMSRLKRKANNRQIKFSDTVPIWKTNKMSRKDSNKIRRQMQNKKNNNSDKSAAEEAEDIRKDPIQEDNLDDSVSKVTEHSIKPIKKKYKINKNYVDDSDSNVTGYSIKHIKKNNKIKKNHVDYFDIKKKYKINKNYADGSGIKKKYKINKNYVDDSDSNVTEYSIKHIKKKNKIKKNHVDDSVFNVTGHSIKDIKEDDNIQKNNVDDSVSNVTGYSIEPIKENDKIKKNNVDDSVSKVTENSVKHIKIQIKNNSLDDLAAGKKKQKSIEKSKLQMRSSSIKSNRRSPSRSAMSSVTSKRRLIYDFNTPENINGGLSYAGSSEQISEEHKPSSVIEPKLVIALHPPVMNKVDAPSKVSFEFRHKQWNSGFHRAYKVRILPDTKLDTSKSQTNTTNNYNLQSVNNSTNASSFSVRETPRSFIHHSHLSGSYSPFLEKRNTQEDEAKRSKLASDITELMKIVETRDAMPKKNKIARNFVLEAQTQTWQTKQPRVEKRAKYKRHTMSTKLEKIYIAENVKPIVIRRYCRKPKAEPIVSPAKCPCATCQTFNLGQMAEDPPLIREMKSAWQKLQLKDYYRFLIQRSALECERPTQFVRKCSSNHNSDIIYP